MANQFVSTQSLQKIFIQVTTTAVADPTGDTVQVAVVPNYTQPSTWVAGTWVKQAGVFFVSVLIGPGSTIGQLTAGPYQVFVKIEDNPETPVLKSADTLTIF